jgi:hypothetical protein
METIVEQLNIEGLDRQHFLLFLNNQFFREPLPEGYLFGVGYIELCSKVKKVIYNNAVSVNPTAFSQIKIETISTI